MNRRPWKIVSGGQTGVDRAGLAAAMSYSIKTGGWIPCGRLAEDGVVPEGFYTLKECSTGGFRERTRMNVVDSDATLRSPYSCGGRGMIDAMGVMFPARSRILMSAKNDEPHFS